MKRGVPSPSSSRLAGLGVACTLLLTPLLFYISAPSASATVLVTYFNFNDGDLNSDGGVRSSKIENVTGLTTSFPSAGTTTNAIAGDAAGKNLRLTYPDNGNNPRSFTFTVDTTNLTLTSLSFATQANVTGLTTTVMYSLNGGSTYITATPSTFAIPMQSPGPGYATATFNVSGASNTNNVIFKISFSGTGGKNNFIDIDNLRIDAVPEPATLGGGILGVFGLCWHQRRRLARARDLFNFRRDRA